LALAEAARIAERTKDSYDPELDGSNDLIDHVTLEVSLAVLAELKTAGYLTPPDPGVT